MFVSFANWAQVSIEWRFVHVVEGYDHQNKMKIYVDGQFVSETGSCTESDWCSYKMPLSKGKHTIKLVNYALYEGNWEEHTIANDYSIDVIYEKTFKMKKKHAIKLEIDIDEENTDAIDVVK